MSIVYRPKSSDSRIHSKDEFELCYIRHKYFRKTLHNPTDKEMSPYAQIMKTLSHRTYYTYKNLFQSIGFEHDDVENIARIHLVSFLGLFSLESAPHKYREFVSSYKKNSGEKPSESELLGKNKANFTLFLKQRMEDVVRICRQKARNIRGMPTEVNYFFCGTKRPPRDLNKLIDNYEELGYKKIDLSSFRTIRKKANKLTDTKFKFNKKWYIAVPLEHRVLELSDLSGSGLDPYDNIHNMNPEQLLFHKEEEEYWDKKKEDFKNTPKDDKVHMVSQFVKKNASNPLFKEEVEIAERLLEKLGADLE
jgi:hypothetical protein